MVPCPVCTLRRGPADCRCLEGTLVPPVFDERPVLGRLRRPEPEIAWCSTTIDVIEAYHQFAGTSSTALAPRFSERGGLANLLESMGPGWRSSGYALASDELARQLGKRWCRHSKYLSCRPSQPKWPWHQGDGANSRREPCLPARSRRIDHTDGETLLACYMRPVPVRATSKQPLARAGSWPQSVAQWCSALWPLGSAHRWQRTIKTRDLRDSPCIDDLIQCMHGFDSQHLSGNGVLGKSHGAGVDGQTKEKFIHALYVNSAPNPSCRASHIELNKMFSCL